MYVDVVNESRRSGRAPVNAVAASLVVVVLLVLASCGRKEGEGGSSPGGDRVARVARVATMEESVEKPTALAVDAVLVSEGRLVPSIQAGGVVEGRQEALVTVLTPGRIEHVYGEIGLSVEPGQTLLQLDNTIYKIGLDQAREAMNSARIVADAQERLLESGGISQSGLYSSRSAYRGAQAGYELAQKNYEDTTLTTPIGGSISWKADDLEIGNYLDSGRPVFRVTDLSGIRITLSVGERQVGLIMQGNRAEITIPALPLETALVGRVSAVGAGSDENSGAYRVLVEVDTTGHDGIKSGMTAYVSITTDDPRSGVIIPGGSITTVDGSDTVLLSVNGVVEVRKIRLGASLGNRQLVLEGLAAGETLIISGTGVLGEGAAVEPRLVGTSEERS